MKFFKVIFGLGIGAVSILALIAVIIGAVLLSLPHVSEISGCMTTSMYHVHLCPTGEHYSKLEQISPDVAHAVIASEDTSFYSHHGFDWYEIEQSFKSNLEAKHIHRGGSTLTQQLAKNVWLGKEKSYWRKLKEAYLTYELEKKYDKNFILEKYLNVVQFGPKVYGVKDAAQFYFKKTPGELHLLEATFLAFVLPNPDVYWKSYQKGELSPFAKKIIGIILKRMVQFKTISPDEYQFALNEMGHFPWRGLTKADFQNAHFGNTAVVDGESPQDANALDQFWSEDAGGEDVGDSVPQIVTPTLAAPVSPSNGDSLVQPSEPDDDGGGDMTPIDPDNSSDGAGDSSPTQ